MKSPTSKSATILIVDDQEQCLQIVGTLLTEMGFEVIPAHMNLGRATEKPRTKPKQAEVARNQGFTANGADGRK